MSKQMLDRVSAGLATESSHLFDSSSSQQSGAFYQSSRRARLRGLGLCEVCGGHPWGPRRYSESHCGHMTIEQESPGIYEVAYPDPALAAEAREELEAIIARLRGFQERTVIVGRLLGWSRKRLAVHLGVSQSRVGQIERAVVLREAQMTVKGEG